MKIEGLIEKHWKFGSTWMTPFSSLPFSFADSDITTNPNRQQRKALVLRKTEISLGADGGCHTHTHKHTTQTHTWAWWEVWVWPSTHSTDKCLAPARPRSAFTGQRIRTDGHTPNPLTLQSVCVCVCLWGRTKPGIKITVKSEEDGSSFCSEKENINSDKPVEVWESATHSAELTHREIQMRTDLQ